MTMFPLRTRRSQPTGAPRKNDPKGGGRLVVVDGFVVDDRVKMVFAAATISMLEEETKAAAARVRSSCGGDMGCVAHGIADAVWSAATYDGDEGRRIQGDSGFDIYRTFRRVVTTGRFDCDCATVSTVALGSLLGLSIVARVIEQRSGSLGGWAWSHIWPILIAVAIPGVPPLPGLAGRSQVPLELTPVPPDGHKAAPGWQTSRSSYRRHFDFLYEPEPWRAWLAASDLARGRFAPFPRIHQAQGVVT